MTKEPLGLKAIEETVSVGGLELHTRTVGEGPDVIVLHGGPGAHHDYLLPHFDALATGRRLRYYDQRGGACATTTSVAAGAPRWVATCRWGGAST